MLCFRGGDIAGTKVVQKNKLDCGNISNDQRISPLGLSKYAIDPDSIKSASDEQVANEIHDGGRIDFVLVNVLNIFKYATKESCAPYDKIHEKFGTNFEAADKAWSGLERQFNEYKDKKTNCLTCLAKNVTQYFNVNVSNDQVLKAFEEQTFSRFRFKLLVPEVCNSEQEKIKFKYINSFSYPASDQAYGHDYKNFISTIKENISKNIPVAVSGVCTMKKPPDNFRGCREENHTLVVSGYKMMCSPKGDCYDALKVHNSFGQEWQTKNNDGWVAAKPLLDRTGYGTRALSWIY